MMANRKWLTADPSSPKELACSCSTHHYSLALIIIIIIKLYFRHIYGPFNIYSVVHVQHLHRGYATDKIYSTVRQCFLNLELKSDVLATVFTTLLSELSTRCLKP